VTGRRRLGLVAAGATLLSSAPLSAIFERWTWLIQCTLAVGLVAGAALLSRTLRAPAWAQLAAQAGALLLALTWMFPSTEELFGFLPTPATFGRFGDLMTQAAEDTRSYGVPVPDRDALLFLAVVGVGAVSILVDVLTVVVRKPALAGLPMLAIYSVPVAVYVDSVPVLPFVVGAVGFLWLLVADNVDRVRRFGRRFTGEGRDVDVWEPSPLAAAGRRLAVIGVAVAVLLPLAVPGLTTGLLTQLTATGVGNGPGGGPGGSGRVNLFANLSGRLNETRTFEMARVTTTERDPFYLRIGVGDVINDQGFANRPPAGRSVTRGSLPDPRQGGAPAGVNRQQYRATVRLTKDFDMSLAPTYPSVIGTRDLNTTWLYDPNAQVVFSNRESASDRTYSFDYVRSLYTPQALRTAGRLGVDNPIRQEFTTVPPLQEVTDLVAGLTRNADTEYDKVIAIYEHFSTKNGFRYSLQTEPGASGDQIVSFLTNKVGFCQQYAAAMAWLVREAGIPARVAFGFTRGVLTNGAYVLTNKNLHSWTEVYFEGFGWVPFDATPAAAVGGARSAWAPDVDAVTTPAPDVSPTSAGGTAAPDTSTNPAGGLNRDTDRGAPGSPGAAAAAGMPWRTISLVAAVALLLALLAVPATLRRTRRRHRHHAAAPALPAVTTVPGSPPVEVTVDAVRARADAHAAWEELVDTMVDYRISVDPTESPRTTAQRLVRQVDLAGESADSAVLLGRAEERARYARQPLQEGELIMALARIRKAFRAASDKRTRLRAALLPPSVTLRWRLALADASVRLVNRSGRVREAFARMSPRRLIAHRAKS
jgi:transglutaminase-like putative cysteine protease